MIDLDNPAHVEALRWACDTRISGALAILEASPLVQLSVGCGVAATIATMELSRAALAAIDDPPKAADLLCRLLERFGIYSSRIECLDPGELSMAWGYTEPCDDHLPGECDHGVSREIGVPMERIPRLVMALLGAKNGADAEAALRGDSCAET